MCGDYYQVELVLDSHLWQESRCPISSDGVVPCGGEEEQKLEGELRFGGHVSGGKSSAL